MMLLGGGTVGDERVVELCSRDIPKSVVGYVSTVITNGRGARLLNPNDFLIHVSDYNKEAPSNMYLLCGDGNMEPMAPAINEAALARALTPDAQPWKWVIEIFKKFVDNIADCQDDWMVFVDTNSSYFIKATKIISTKEQFRNYYSISLRDFNTAGVVCAHLGRLLSSMKQGYYKVYGIDVKVNSEKNTRMFKCN